VSLVDDVRQRISDRLKELEPLVAEYRQLQSMQEALDSASPAAEPPAPEPTRRRSQRRTSTSASPRRRSGESRGGGSGGDGGGRRRTSGATRASQALELVRARPGITIPEIAQEMGIQQNYLYRVLPSLEADGQVRKEGRGWHPATNGAGEAPAADAIEVAATDESE
jgi:transposase-like protein